MAKLFDTGVQFPPTEDIERLSKYYRGKAIFDGNLFEVYERASDMLKDTPHAPQLEKLYIAVNIADTLVTKPADLMVGEPPIYESGLPDDSIEQARLNSIVEENDLNQLIHESVIGGGYRGDSFIKTIYKRRQDFSEVPLDGEGAPLIDLPDPEPIIESVPAQYVFPELAKGSNKRFKAINIAWVEWVDVGNDEKPFLNVERHVPGFIFYDKFALHPKDVVTQYGVPLQTYLIGEQVATGRDNDVVATGITHLPVFHSPYKSVDDEWQGVSGIEKMESVLAAINDRLVQIDYILWKHSDPTAYGPDLEGNADGGVRTGGKYIPITEGDVTPGYMTWDSQLDGAFKELDILLGLVFQMSETPQWLFGTTLTEDKGGTGTSHTDGAAIKARFMPILSKVKRIRTHVDRAVRDALWTAMLLENYANEDVDGFESYNAVYPKVQWKDGIPANEKELAEIMQIRTGNRPTLDVQSAIKRMDETDDGKAKEVIDRIQEDEKREGFVDPSVFNA